MSLSLVAYGSSDENEDSSSEDNDIGSNVNNLASLSNKVTTGLSQFGPAPSTDSDRGSINTIKAGSSTSLTDANNIISDDDDDVLVAVSDVEDISSGLRLPPAKHEDGQLTVTPVNTQSRSSSNSSPNTGSDNLFVLGLPAPKPIDRSAKAIQTPTEDDELEEMVKPKAAELAHRVQPPEKKKKKVIKITAPNISNFDSDDEDEPIKKKLKPSSGGSGLFALLPQPRHVSIKEAGRSLLPHTLTKKPVSTIRCSPKPAVVKPVVTNVVKPPGPRIADHEESDDEEESSKSGNYFSIGNASQQGALLSASSYSVTSSLSTLPPVGRQKSECDMRLAQVNEMPSPFGCRGGGALADIPLPFKSTMSTFIGPSGPTRQEQSSTYPHMSESVNNESYNMAGVDEVYPDESGDIGLPAEELLKLQGKSKWGKEEINIIDVHADHQTSAVELTKHLTEEVDMVSHSKKKKDQPTSQQKRKHQITYLAHRAKEREFDLKNQWAQNKMTKRQSQSKYGF